LGIVLNGGTRSDDEVVGSELGPARFPVDGVGARR